MKWSAALACLAAVGCSGLELDPPAEVIHARFDPEAKVVPMPTDILRDEEAGRLDLPIDGDLTRAERALYTYFNKLDGWSSAMPATVEFTGPVDPGTVGPETVEVWEWRPTPRRVEGVSISLDASETELTIAPPRTGWNRAATYVVMLRGGPAGVEGKRGELVEADAAFYFLRLTDRLDVPEHERAFPGETAAKRRQNAEDLEEIRRDLAPFFDFFEQERDVPRREVAALWSFTVTERVELAMDKRSQRMPLPIDLLLDPESGRVDLPEAPWDSETVARAKVRLAEYDGYGLSAPLLFGFTGRLAPETVTSESVRLYRMEDPPARVPAAVEVLEDGRHVEVSPESLLDPQATYAVALADTIRDAGGGRIALMPAGILMRLEVPVFEGGKSTVEAAADEDARRLERVRLGAAPLYDRLGREPLLSAWTFTTMSVTERLSSLMQTPEELGVPADPIEVERMSPLEALAEFPLAISSLLFVGDVYHGAIRSPVFLDPETRAFRTDGGHREEKIRFTMTVPRGVEEGESVPVVIFGHGVLTERRFVLAVGDALAARGFAAVAIDFPYHGERTYCFQEGPLSVPNPRTGELTPLTDPCEEGGTCSDDGRCVTSSGEEVGFKRWPILGMYQASGAAFLEIDHIANSRDHFRQALVDLSALARSLRRGDWESATGVALATEKLYYAGQSLGGIIGGTFLSMATGVERAVLNVPGADVVDMFDESPYFGPQVDAFFTREEVERESYDGHRFLNVARWLMDEVDPQTYASRMEDQSEVMLQMATLDFIIPNDFTRTLEELSGAPRRDYVAEHGFLAIPVEPEYLRGVNELAEFVAGELSP